MSHKSLICLKIFFGFDCDMSKKRYDGERCLFFRWGFHESVVRSRVAGGFVPGVFPIKFSLSIISRSLVGASCLCDRRIGKHSIWSLQSSNIVRSS